MADIENRNSQVPLIALDGVDSRPVKSGHWFKISLGVALLCGLGLAFSIMAQPASGPRDSTTEATESTNLVGLSPKLQTSSAAESLCTTTGSLCIPITSPYQKLAVAGWKALNEGKSMRDVAMMAQERAKRDDGMTIGRLKEDDYESMSISAQRKMDPMTRKIFVDGRDPKSTDPQVRRGPLDRTGTALPKGIRSDWDRVMMPPDSAPVAVEDMPGITVPMGFWDPAGLSADIPQGRLLWFREAELKHGRVAMLGTLGLLVSEKFHPFFGVGDIPMTMVFKDMSLSLTLFWFNLFFLCFLFEGPTLSAYDGNINTQALNENFVPGNFGFDPLNIKPRDPEAWKTIQTKEINNGRLAMVGFMGMLAEELLTGKQIDPLHPPWGR